jgi:hypothetical protein
LETVHDHFRAVSVSSRWGWASHHRDSPKRVRRARIVALSLLVLSGIINYVDRGTLAVANHNIATSAI